MNNYFLQFCFLIFLFGCGGEPAETSTTIDPKPIIKKEVKPQTATFIASMDHLRVRDSAGKKGEVIGNLSVGDKVVYAGEKSDFTTPVKLRGYPYSDPWLKIITENGDEGWVYGGGVNFGENMDNDLVKPLIDNRIEKLFGKKMSGEIQSFQHNFRTANNSEDLSKTYRQALELRDELVKTLHDDIEVADPQKAVNMDWLAHAMPGFINQLAAEGTMFHLFFYYEDWAKKARRTSGKEDNDFFELMYAIYPVDNIEHFFPGWFLQTWDYGGHSELGKGVHNRLLEQMNKLLAESDLFAPEIETLKNNLVQDITNTENTYWYDKKAILVELNAILAANYGILTSEDKVGLETRKKHFENPEENSIKLDFRSGNN